MEIDQAQRIISDAAAKLGAGELSEHAVVEHLHPLFSRVLARNKNTDEIYLANHSLGRPMDMVSDLVQGALDGWYERLDGVWEEWIAARDRYRAEIARLLCWPDERAVVPKSSAAQGLRAVLNAMPDTKLRIVSTECEFDSIDFVLRVYHEKSRAAVDWVRPDVDGLMQPDAMIHAIETKKPQVVVLSAVCFASGQAMQSLGEIIESAHRNNAVVVLDAYHAFGVLPIDFHALGADFVIAGNYKYTRGGAGACFLAIHPRHLSESAMVPTPDSIAPLDTGWFAKLDTFSYARHDSVMYAVGGNAWLEATPPVLTYYQALAGLMLTNTIGVDRLRQYSLKQQVFLARSLSAMGVTPRLLEHRGGYILIEDLDGASTIARLKDAGVNADARPQPDSDNWLIRLCPDLLNTSAELEEAADRIGRVLSSA